MNTPHAIIVRGPLLNPRSDVVTDWFADGALAADANGRISYVGAWSSIAAAASSAVVRQSDGIIMPPLFDAHTHISQFPIRGRFLAGVGEHPEGGRLLAGLNRNVFPAEAMCSDAGFAEKIIRDFLADTLSKGVIGGAAYMTVHAQATRLALEILPETWSVGLVLMNQNCPPDLRTDEANLDRDIAELAGRFGRRLIVTDRFAPVVNSPLRQKAAALSKKFGLRMQTHLDEQITEKEFVERVMYPEAKSYTDVYRNDGLLSCEPILAHCIWMTDAEIAQVAAAPGALVAHCPTSNMLLGSGLMSLERISRAGINYAICTDVGASPTTSLLAEAVQFLIVHAAATPQAALFRITHAPAAALGVAKEAGTFEVGKPMSFIEVESDESECPIASAKVIQSALLRLDRANRDDLPAAVDAVRTGNLGTGSEADLLAEFVAQTARSLDDAVNRVTVDGRMVWARSPS
jgi:guanine deaminase